MKDLVRRLSTLGLNDLAEVGGKNASLGELLGQLSGLGVKVPDGFATTAEAFRTHLAETGLDQRVAARLNGLDVEDLPALKAAGAEIRQWILQTPLSAALESAISAAYTDLEADYGVDCAVAVRSSATAEDLPDASFAGQQETFLNVRGCAQVLARVREVYASLYTDRAIAYRDHHGYAHAEVALSVGVQHMVRADLGASGVLFTLDTESGFRKVVLITASYGLGELIVQGAVNPDEYVVHKATLEAGHRPIVRRVLGSKASKMVYGENGMGTLEVPVAEADRTRFCLSDDEVLELARLALIVEHHYGRPMDIEWARDGVSGELMLLQARPETVKSRAATVRSERYVLRGGGPVLVEGRAIGQKIGRGTARVVRGSAEMSRVQAGDVLVTEMTDPDWEPVMKRASAIVTNRGGRTCHAAIIARELGIPAIVGTGDGTRGIGDGRMVTVSCAEGDTGKVYDGLIDFEVLSADLGQMPPAPLKLMLNVAHPERAFEFAQLPNHGVGLARLEFIINSAIGIHPRALLDYDKLGRELKLQIDQRIAGYPSPVDYYVDRLAEGMATIAAAFHPDPVILRLSDFKSNEYAELLGGRAYEPHEENPMLGYRGAARYLSADFAPAFALECRAVRKVREQMGLTNAWVMIPFVRTVTEARGVVELLASHGLRRGENGLKLIMMCELPSNALLAERFLEYFDGFSIGSNDLTQLTLGLDRDSEKIAPLFDERNAAVKVLLARAIKACREAGKYIGICGQGPSDHPDLAEWLLDQGIESLSLNPDTVVETWIRLARHRAP